MSQLAHRRLLRLGAEAAVVGITTLALAGGPASAASTTPSGTARVQVAQGINPATISGATETGATASDTQLTVSFVLDANDLSALEAKVDAGWTGPYLTTAQFADDYGQPTSFISRLSSYLGGYGIASTPKSDDLDVVAHGTVAQFDQALSIKEADYTIPAAGKTPAQQVHAAASNPSLPSALGAHVLSILGLSSYAPYSAQSVAAPGNLAGATSTPGHNIPVGASLPQGFESEYGLSGLDSAGDLGQGQTLGIVALASINPNVPQRFWNKIGVTTKPNRIAVDKVDGGSGPATLARDDFETAMDVEQAGAIAPQANIALYEAPDTDEGFVDAFFTAASQNVAGSVSTSWGAAEVDLQVFAAGGNVPPNYAQTFDEAFLELAAQGQSSFTATGDLGAYAGAGTSLPSSIDSATSLSLESPSDSPYTTATGATTNAKTLSFNDVQFVDGKDRIVGVDEVNVPDQLTWSTDYTWPINAYDHGDSIASEATQLDEIGGSGGGYNPTITRPSYQQNVSGVSSYTADPYLVSIDPHSFNGVSVPTQFGFDPTPSLTPGTATAGRATPDLAFDGDPSTGYAVFDPQWRAAYHSPYMTLGGTSVVAAQLDATTAVFGSALGHRVGFWNPTIYSVAQAPGSPFTPIDDDQTYSGMNYLSATSTSAPFAPKTIPGSFSNNNLYYTGTPGAVYNPGSGLGYANLGLLETDFAAH